MRGDVDTGDPGEDGRANAEAEGVRGPGWEPRAVRSPQKLGQTRKGPPWSLQRGPGLGDT